MTYCIQCNADPCICPPRSPIHDRVQGMTSEEKQAEVMRRLDRLGAIRGELSVLKSSKQKQLKEVVDAAKQITRNPSIFGKNAMHWPSSTEVYKTITAISEIREEADQLIGELKDLGVDEGLLTINGE